MTLPRGEALLLPGSKSLFFSVPVGLDATGVWVPSLCPPGWESWCERSELGSLSCTGQGFCGGWKGTLTVHITWLSHPKGSSWKCCHWHCREGDLDKCGVFPNPLQCPSRGSAVVGAQQGPTQLNLSRGGCRAAAPWALPTQGTFPAGSMSGCRSLSRLKWTCQP